MQHRVITTKKFRQKSQVGNGKHIPSPEANIQEVNSVETKNPGLVIGK
jgi:hypothetical protein